MLERPDIPDDGRFCDNEARCYHRAELDGIINGVFTVLDRDVLVERLRQAAIAFGEVNEVAGLSAHSALRRTEIETPTGPASIVAPPARINGEEAQLRPVPALGEHSEQIRREFTE